MRPKAEKTDQTALYRSINSNAKKYKCEKCPLSKTSNLYSKTYIHFKIDLPAHVMYPNALPKIVSGRRCVLTLLRIHPGARYFLPGDVHVICTNVYAKCLYVDTHTMVYIVYMYANVYMRKRVYIHQHV